MKPLKFINCGVILALASLLASAEPRIDEEDLVIKPAKMVSVWPKTTNIWTKKVFETWIEPKNSTNAPPPSIVDIWSKPAKVVEIALDKSKVFKSLWLKKPIMGPEDPKDSKLPKGEVDEKKPKDVTEIMKAKDVMDAKKPKDEADTKKPKDGTGDKKSKDAPGKKKTKDTTKTKGGDGTNNSKDTTDSKKPKDIPGNKGDNNPKTQMNDGTNRTKNDYDLFDSLVLVKNNMKKLVNVGIFISKDTILTSASNLYNCEDGDFEELSVFGYDDLEDYIELKVDTLTSFSIACKENPNIALIKLWKDDSRRLERVIRPMTFEPFVEKDPNYKIVGADTLINFQYSWNISASKLGEGPCLPSEAIDKYETICAEFNKTSVDNCGYTQSFLVDLKNCDSNSDCKAGIVGTSPPIMNCRQDGLNKASNHTFVRLTPFQSWIEANL